MLQQIMARRLGFHRCGGDMGGGARTFELVRRGGSLPHLHRRYGFSICFLRFQLTRSPRIVEALDVIEDVSLFLYSGLISTTIAPLLFQHPEAPFSCCMVCTAANTTHRTDHVVALEEALILVAGELGAAI